MNTSKSFEIVYFGLFVIKFCQSLVKIQNSFSTDLEQFRKGHETSMPTIVSVLPLYLSPLISVALFWSSRLGLFIQKNKS